MSSNSLQHTINQAASAVTAAKDNVTSLFNRGNTVVETHPVKDKIVFAVLVGLGLAGSIYMRVRRINQQSSDDDEDVVVRAKKEAQYAADKVKKGLTEMQDALNDINADNNNNTHHPSVGVTNGVISLTDLGPLTIGIAVAVAYLRLVKEVGPRLEHVDRGGLKEYSTHSHPSTLFFFPTI